MSSLTLTLTEPDRQLVLMALAELSLAKPGFDAALNWIALRIENTTIDSPNPRAPLYEEFRRFAADRHAA